VPPWFNGFQTYLERKEPAMPHLRLEYTANVPQKVDFDALFSELHHTLANVGGASLGNCKGRAFRLDDYFVADGQAAVAFVHLDVRVLEGRSDEWKQTVGAALMNVLKAHYTPSGVGPAVQLTLEIQDIHKSAYFKT